MIYFNNNRGLTLLELVVSMTVLLIILAAIVPLFSTSLSLTSNGMIQNNLRQEGRWMVDLISKELRGIDIRKVTSPSQTGERSNTLTFTSFHNNNSVTYTVPVGMVEVYRLNHPITDGQRANIKPSELTFTKNSDGESIDIHVKLTQTDNKNIEHSEIIMATIKPLNNDNDH